MSNFFRTDAIKRLGKKAKSKRGATLIEMVATVAILSIVATLSLEAMFIASSEQRRVTNLSEAQRSISLMQENLNKYLKTAVYVELCSGYAGEATVEDAIQKFTNDKNSPSSSDPLQDNDTPDLSGAVDDYNDYIFYRSGTFSYTLAKYYRYHGGYSNVFVPIFTVDNIKELKFSVKSLGSLNITPGNQQYIMDYAITSPTHIEFRDGKAVDTDDPNTPEDDILKNIQKGEYSIATGTILNNIYGTSITTAVSSLRISEGLASDGSNDGSDKHFVFIRTTPKVEI